MLVVDGGMMNAAYWTEKLRQAEQEIDAAKRRSDVDAAAGKLQYAKAQLRALEEAAKKPKRRPNRSLKNPRIWGRDVIRCADVGKP